MFHQIHRQLSYTTNICKAFAFETEQKTSSMKTGTKLPDWKPVELFFSNTGGRPCHIFKMKTTRRPLVFESEEEELTIQGLIEKDKKKIHKLTMQDD